MTKLVHVAVGVIINTDGKILIAKRPLSAHQGGLWEFPGGKVDDGETIQQALVRELREELAVNVQASEPLIQIRHHYPDKSVLLDVHRVTAFSGEPCGNEGQPVQWVDSRQLYDFEFPVANRPIIAAVNLPFRYLITGSFSSEADFSIRLNQALAAGVGLVQLRIKEFDLNRHHTLLDIALASVKGTSAYVQINTSPDRFKQILNDYSGESFGLHLSAKEALALNEPLGLGDYLLGVSCHNAEEIIHAQRIGADYLLLSPVLPTCSHPEVTPLGWSKFANLIELANVPVYALGGIGDGLLNTAKRHGAQGIAGISAWW